MRKCPNCGRETARTEDWSCQWCGYPLLSGSYKKISKTYKQLKEERLPQQPVLGELEPELTPVLESELEIVSEPELEIVSEAEPEAVPEPEPAAEPKPRAKRKPVAKSKAKTKSKPAAKPKSAPKAEPERASTAIEITVAELLYAYESDVEAAGARFAKQSLRVTGVVDRIEVRDTLAVNYITLTTTETNLLQHVRCTFDKKYGFELNQLAPGQMATVQGKYDGSIIDISLRDCVLVH